MPDVEKVIRGLECCLPPHDPNCDLCPYDSIDLRCRAKLCDDVMALLKAQGPSDDCISRNRLKNEIQYYIEEAGWGEEINKALGWCLEFIDNQEAVKWE